MVVEGHRLAGVFVAKGGKDDALVTRNLDAGKSVYGEKRITVEVQHTRAHTHTQRRAVHSVHLSECRQPHGLVCPSLTLRCVCCCACVCRGWMG